MSIEQVQVLAVPTVTRLGPETVGSVLVGGSHAAIFTTYLTLKAGARAAIQHDAAFGRDRAGIAGLAWAEQFGFAMAAVDARTARIGDGADMLERGTISAVNRHAAAYKVEPGMSCGEAADLLRAAAEPSTRPASMLETRSEATVPGTSRVVVMVDSVALARESDVGGIVSTGSHGGTPSDGYAAKVGMQLVLFNDAGFGADDAGIASLPILERKGIAAATVSAFTARIGDGRSTYADGIISAANARALALGAIVGAAAKDFVAAMARG
ncbi:hypothetical protein [Ramlibacter tataouinensis]|uniref:Uncharacterized protein n=1 Tax=Ramlibacter tataouinensis (strain ATCC BAA-407 / DSM 14655 / LMG 21543 / TTB310) TaxID=365046 RepID=F5Y6F4_RAMTT|nr:hypothetical protein [Ramlibacter tataouinensis]AEG94028.1 conserved hypothetical protein [Ramlibacter tataouinensis TTB310]